MNYLVKPATNQYYQFLHSNVVMVASTCIGSCGDSVESGLGNLVLNLMVASIICSQFFYYSD